MSGFELPDQHVEPIPIAHRDLLSQFHTRNLPGNLPKGELLHFSIEREFPSLSVYNPVPVVIDSQTYIWARVEEKEIENKSVGRLFKEGTNGEWDIVAEAHVFDGLQDPFYCGMIEGKHIFGGVQVKDVEGSHELGYRTVFYQYSSKAELLNPKEKIPVPFAVGPDKMKGIRLIQLKDGGIGVFTRPQNPPNQFGERGQIGYFQIESLGGLQKALDEYDQPINKNTLIKGLFIDEKLSLEKGLGDGEWGGVNELYLLADGKIGVLGHIAGFGDEKYLAPGGETMEFKKDYYPITFIFDPDEKTVSKVKIIATTGQFKHVEAKMIHLGKILYSGGMVRREDGNAWLYVGIGDSKAGRILIKDPFLE